MHRFVLATSFAIVGWFTALTSSAAVLYVDKAASGQNDGTSWADAFNHLQDALAAAQDGDELWVAHGTYRPSEGSGSSSRDVRFLIPGRVEVYGGFTGTETARDQRVLEGRPQTILEGDDITTPWRKLCREASWTGCASPAVAPTATFKEAVVFTAVAD